MPDEPDQRAVDILKDFNDFPHFDNWKTFAENIAIYGEERKSGIVGGRTPGQIDSSKIWDTTLRDALEVFSAGIVSDLTPQSEAWLEIESQSFTASKEEKDFYNKASDRVRTRVGQSNFYRGFHESIHSGGLLGTFCMAMLPSKKRKFNFTEIPFGRFRFREDADGYASTVYHEWEEATAAQIQEFFQEELESGAAQLPDMIKEALASDNPETRNKKFCIVHRVRPRLQSSGEIPAKAEDRPFESDYVCKETNTSILANDGLYYQPYIVCRILKSRHDGGFGRSPGTQVYPIVRVLNRATRDTSVALEKNVRPPMLTPKDSTSRRDDRPGGEIVYDPHIPNGAPAPYVVPFDLQSVDWFMQRLERQIKAAFFNGMFKFFTDQQVATTEKTAFEAQLQAEEQLRLFTPIFQNIVDECLSPVIENVFTEMFLTGDFADLLEGIGDEEAESISNFQVVYDSRIAKAVKSQRNQGLIKVANAANIIEAFAPGAGARALDWERALKEVAINSSVSGEHVNSDDVIDQLKAKDAEVQELMQQVEVMHRASQSAAQLQAGAGSG
jgi:hypothetical protein